MGRSSIASTTERHSGNLKSQDVVGKMCKCCAGGWREHTGGRKAGLDGERPEQSRAPQAERKTSWKQTCRSQGPPVRQPRCQLAFKALGYSASVQAPELP